MIYAAMFLWQAVCLAVCVGGAVAVVAVVRRAVRR